ncbi:carbon-nitrogen hydrolase family protein [uncultured Bifidobacterium sp.]|uniref:carbon-nitrogen hydrolase family protein n=1 Tax=uncultured Bifidobacterium sp. TaxID=165187 RepID=UPI0028DD2E35|nr:carbon-nitrogen hydrolase family protein [uncultured Bifidobacterium sp.]
MSVRIGCLQVETRPDDVDANLATLRDMMKAAAKQGVELLIVPEMFVTGYNTERRPENYPQSLWLDVARDICREEGVALVAGAPEVVRGDDGRAEVFNSAFLIDSTGEVLSVYRKTHLFGDEEKALFSPGEVAGNPVMFRGISIGILICYDVEFPENVRRYAMQGVDLIAVPTAQMVPFEFVAETMIPTRAWENQCYVAYVNHDGVERGLRYVGRSSICGPNGDRIVTCVHGTHLLVADIDPLVVVDGRRKNPYLLDRRPELY